MIKTVVRTFAVVAFLAGVFLLPPGDRYLPAAVVAVAAPVALTRGKLRPGEPAAAWLAAATFCIAVPHTNAPYSPHVLAAFVGVLVAVAYAWGAWRVRRAWVFVASVAIAGAAGGITAALGG